MLELTRVGVGECSSGRACSSNDGNSSHYYRSENSCQTVAENLWNGIIMIQV